MKRRRTTLELKRFLQEEFPPPIPVRVIRCTTELDTTKKPYERDFGETEDKGTHFLIRLNKNHPSRIQKDTLLHEYAHVLADWSEADEHSNKWGKVYAMIYRKVVEENI